MIPLVPETKMVDIGKLISLGNLLVRKVMWFVLTTMSAPLILLRAFGADHMTRIVNIYSHLPRTHSLTFWLPETALSLSLSSFRLPETAWPCHLVRHNSIRVTLVRIHSTTFFFPQKFHQILKETNNQHREYTFLLEYTAIFLYIDTSLEIFSQHTFYHIYHILLGQDMTQGQFFKRSLTGLNSEFSFS